MKAYKGFLPKLDIDEEQDIIRGKTLNTRDTITFYGKTVGEALQAFRDSVDDYLDFCNEMGVEPEKPYNGKLLVRVRPEIHRDLSLIAQQQGKSINSFIAGQLAVVVKRSGLRGNLPRRDVDEEARRSYHPGTTRKPKKQPSKARARPQVK